MRVQCLQRPKALSSHEAGVKHHCDLSDSDVVVENQVLC